MKTTAKRKSLFKKLAIFFLIVLLVSSVMVYFQPVADFIGQKFNTTGQRVKNVALSIAKISLGLFLISVGAGTALVPIVGVALVVIGLALVVWGAWPLFKKDESQVEPEKKN